MSDGSKESFEQVKSGNRTTRQIRKDITGVVQKTWLDVDRLLLTKPIPYVYI